MAWTVLLQWSGKAGQNIDCCFDNYTIGNLLEKILYFGVYVPVLL